MSLITCCPSCGTKFRVVADQLRISDGWVRCGRCQEVFDAQAALDTLPVAASAPAVAPQAVAPVVSVPPQSLQASAAAEPPKPEPLHQPIGANAPASAAEPAPAPAVVEAPVKVAAPVAAPAPLPTGYELPAPPELDLDFEITDIAPHAPQPATAERGDVDDWLDLPSVDTRRELALQALAVPPSPVKQPQTAAPLAAATAPAQTHWEPHSVLKAEETQASMWAEVVRFIHPPKPEAGLEGAVAQPAPVAAAAAIDAAAHLDTKAADSSETFAQATQVPGFVKQAQRKAWWNQPGVRFVMGMLLILLPIALLLQMVVHERNRLAAWKPEWRNGLEVMCVVLRCEITPYKNIASVVLTGSAFVQDALPHHYKLDLSIQNQATMSVATPAVELTLTDAQDQVLVRKVLNLADIGAPKELAARGEWNGTLPIMTQGLNLPVSGYRVMAFYP